LLLVPVDFREIESLQDWLYMAMNTQLIASNLINLAENVNLPYVYGEAAAQGESLEIASLQISDRLFFRAVVQTYIRLECR
jgi:hypothetical protein